MTEAQILANWFVTYGAGIVALVVVFTFLIILMINFPKYWKEWQAQKASQETQRVQQQEAFLKLTTVATEVIRANTEAFHDSAQSTQNMAKALELLTAMYERTSKTLDEHDQRAQLGWNEVFKIGERTSACRTRATDPR